MTNFSKGAILKGALLFLFPFLVSAQSFNAKRAYSYLEAQCALGTREPNSNGHLAAKRYFEDFLRKNKGVFSKNHFTYSDASTKKTLNLTNFHCRFKGKTAKTFLFCAHWDTRPWADRDSRAYNRVSPIPGANDGASGIAVLMELCNILSAKQPEKTIEIVFFDGEDYGRHESQEAWCLGSKHFAKSAGPEKYAYAVVVDMVGDKNLTIRREQHSMASAPWLVQKIWSLAKDKTLPGFLDETGLAIYDDHIPLIEKKIPSVDLIDFDYPYWHTMEDTPDKCSPESLEQVGKILISLIYE